MPKTNWSSYRRPMSSEAYARGIELTLSIMDNVGPELEKFGDEKNQSRILNFILGRVGRRYRAHLKAVYLAGQMINGGHGRDSLSGRILVYKNKRAKNLYTIGEKRKNDPRAGQVKLANIYEHAGGYTILPKTGKLLAIPSGSDSYSVWSGFGKAYHGDWIFTKKPIHGKARPFMSASFASFGWNPVIAAEAKAVFKGEIKKAGLA